MKKITFSSRPLQGVLLVGLVLGAVYLRVARPDLALTPKDSRGLAIASATQQIEPASSFGIIDLDALSRNLERIQKPMQGKYGLRWVAKSLPSPDLLTYIAEQTGNARFMVFQKSMISELLSLLPEADLLLGKPIPGTAAEQLLRAFPFASRRVHWLIDSPERLAEYLDVSQRLQVSLSLVLEIDVGLRRGGFESPRDLDGLKTLIEAHSGAQVQVAGLMGYDGHVSHASPLLGPGKKRASAREFEKVQERYLGFTERLRALFSEPESGWILNGGGSHTYWRYPNSKSPINEIALGSALLKPTHFDDSELNELEPAAFLAVPILKKVTQPFPFVSALGPLWGWVNSVNPNTQIGYYLYGSTWGGEVLYPTGLSQAWFHEGGIQNLLPNQQLLMGSSHVAFPAGQRLIVRPPEGDTIAAFDRLLVIAAGSSPRWWRLMLHRND